MDRRPQWGPVRARALGAGAGALTLVMSLPDVADAQDTRVDAPIPHTVGQSVSASFEGWYPNPDGTRSLVFGYFNRNYEERLDIPVGPNNRFEPGPADPDRTTGSSRVPPTGVSPPIFFRDGRPGSSPWSSRPTSVISG